MDDQSQPAESMMTYDDAAYPPPAFPPTPPPKTRRRVARRLGFTLAALLLLWAATAPALLYVKYQDDRKADRAANIALTSSIASLKRRLDFLDTRAGSIEDKLPVDLAALIEKVKPSVVTVSVGDSLGSGFVMAISDVPAPHKSAIITAAHVVQAATDRSGPHVYVKQGERSALSLLQSWDFASDLALIFSPLDLPTLGWATDNNHKPADGQQVVALGSPFGLEGTTTSGIISKVTNDWIVTDAAINSGNSGGPLLNRYGEVLAVNSFTLSEAQNFNIAVRVERACAEILDCT